MDYAIKTPEAKDVVRQKLEFAHGQLNQSGALIGDMASTPFPGYVFHRENAEDVKLLMPQASQDQLDLMGLVLKEAGYIQ